MSGYWKHVPWHLAMFVLATVLVSRAWAGQEVDALLFGELPVVEGASKFEQRSLDAPASVSVVTGEEIRCFGYRTLAEILRSVRGMQIVDDRSYLHVGMRGFHLPGNNNKRILVLLDGHRMNDAVHGGTLIGEGGIVPASLVRKVEVIRGPSSSLYGTSAVFAVVNVITRRGRDVDGVEVEGEIGSEGRRGRGLTAGRREAGREIETLLHVSSVGEGGRDFFFPERVGPGSDGVAQGLDAEWAKRQYAKVKTGKLSVWAARSRRDKRFPTAPYFNVFGSDLNGSTSDLRAFDMTWEDGDRRGLDRTARLFYDEVTIDGTFAELLTAPPLGVVLNRDRSFGSAWGAEMVERRRMGERQRLAYGFEFRREIHLDQRNDFDELPSFVRIDDSRDEHFLGIFAQSELHFDHRSFLNVGLRRDSLSGRDDFLAPRMAFIHKSRDDRAWKLLFGRAFRSATAFERFYDGGTLKGNEDLRPERVDTWELVYEHEAKDGRRFSASVYRYDMDDFINRVIDPLDGLLQYRNGEAIIGRGFEMEHVWNWRGRGSLGLSYTYAGVRSVGDDGKLPNSPSHDVKLHLGRQLPGGRWTWGLEGLFRSERRSFADEALGSELVWNANLTGQVGRRRPAEVSIRISNLFDRDRVDVVGNEHYPITRVDLPGRGLQLRCTLRF